MENLTEAPSIAKKGTFPATVVKVIDPFTIIINKGEKDGMRQQQRILLYQISTEEIIDPNTGESLGFWEITKGTGRVVNIQDKMATIESDRVIKPTSSILDKAVGIDRSLERKRFESLIDNMKGISETEKLKLLTEGIKQPFENPQVGDKVKPI